MKHQLPKEVHTSNESKGKMVQGLWWNTQQEVNQQESCLPSFDMPRRGPEHEKSFTSFINKKGNYERFSCFLAGLVEGEGALWASVTLQPKALFSINVHIGFSIYQHESGLKLLEWTKCYFKTGRVYMKPGSDTAFRSVWVFEINDRRTFNEKVIPFFKRYVLPLSCKYKDGTFDNMVLLLDHFEKKKHLTYQGLIECVQSVYNMNPHSKGKKRKRSLDEVKNIIMNSRGVPAKNALSSDETVRP